MYNNLLNYCFPTSSDISTTTTPVNPSFDTRIDIEYQEFLPEVYDTWSFIHKLSTDTARFREIYDLYKYERSETEQKSYFNQLKILDDTIYKLSLTIHQRLQYLEKIVQPTLEQFHSNQQNNNNYTPAYIRIAQNQLNSLKFSFQRIITKHNSDSIDYQNDLKQSVENSKEIINSYEQIPSTTTNKIQTLLDANEEKNHLSQIQLQIQQQDLTEQEQQIVDLETRLDSLRILKERVRQMK